MDTLATILGLGGVVLILVGLIGGGFTFSGTVMPAVGKVARVPCFAVGGVMVFLALAVVFYEPAATGTPEATKPVAGTATEPPVTITVPPTLRSEDPASPPGTPAQPPAQPPPQPPPAADDAVIPPPQAPSALSSGTMILNAYVYLEPYLAAGVVGQLLAGTPVSIFCTAFGETVVRADGASSDLWDNIGYGFVPDVVVDTGTAEPVAPPC